MPRQDSNRLKDTSRETDHSSVDKRLQQRGARIRPVCSPTVPVTPGKHGELNIAYRPIAEIKPYPGNPRNHSRKQIGLLARMMDQNGFVAPIQVDENGVILAGHGRLLAAKKLGLATVPTITIGYLSEAEKLVQRIGDNQLASLSSWNQDALRIELGLVTLHDPDFDLELTGFDIGTIEIMLDQADTAADEPEGLATPATGPAVCAIGDVWELGRRHRLVIGDATLREPYLALMGRTRARMVFTDPPYNVPIAGHVSGKGKVKHREFVAASGEMDVAEFTRFLTASLTNMARFSTDGALAYVCMDFRHLGELYEAGAAAFDQLINLCVWVKSNAGMGSPYRSQHELIAVFKRGHLQHVDNIALGKHGRNRSNVWQYPGMSSFSATREAELAMHPTVKPLPLVVDAILDASRKDDIVLDPFAGAGTTALAAEQTGRRARLLELDPLYGDVIIRRCEAAGIKAVDHAGRSFAERGAQVRNRENGHG